MALASTHYFPGFDAGAIEGVLAAWRAAHPRMGVLALLPEAERDAVAGLQALCARRKVPLVGAVFPALIDGETFRTHGVLLLCFPTMPHVTLHADLPRDAEGAAQAAGEIAADVRAHLGDSKEATLFLLFDARVPNIATLLDELYLGLANRVHYMGANAGSETFKPMPCLFDSERLIQDGVLALLLEPHHGAVLDHGYAAPARMRMATSTEGNRIAQIDWQPAFDVYRELVRTQFGVEITPENFYEYAVHFPFGIVRANREILVRIPVSFEADGSLVCVGEVPPNALLTLLEAPAVDSVHTLDTLAAGLAAQNGSLADDELLLFYCAGRRMHLGAEAATRELAALAQRIQTAGIAGALSLGEIGSSTQWGYPLFHNAALVAACVCKE